MTSRICAAGFDRCRKSYRDVHHFDNCQTPKALGFSREILVPMGSPYGSFAASACTRSLRMTIGFASSPTILIEGDVTSVPATVTVAPTSTTVSSHLDVLAFAS